MQNTRKKEQPSNSDKTEGGQDIPDKDKPSQLLEILTPRTASKVHPGANQNQIQMTNAVKTEAKNSIDDELVAYQDEPAVKESDDAYRQRIQLEKEMEPMKLTNWFVDCPCTVLVFNFVILILVTFVVVQNDWIKQTDSTNRDFLIWKSPIVKQLDMRNLAYEYLERNSGASVKDIRSQSQGGWNIVVIFQNLKDKEYGLLRKDNLIKMRDVEKMVNQSLGFQDVCYAQSVNDTNCHNTSSIITPIRFYEFEFDMFSFEPYSQSYLYSKFNEFLHDWDVYEGYESMYDKKVNNETYDNRVEFMRTTFRLGAPLSINGTRFDSNEDRKEEQEVYIEKFLEQVQKNISEQFPSDETGFEVYLFNSFITRKVFRTLVKQDTNYAVFSVGFVFCYLIYHLGSIYLAFIGILIILFSFPVTSLIYTGILKCLYFGSLHNLVIFIVLGIAADDIFVFIDGWRLSKANKQFDGDLHKRMAFAFRRAARAMAVTSSTTSVAFMANVFSPLMPIRGFGVYSGVIVPVNYLLVVMILPPATIWYERHIDGCFTKICCKIFSCFNTKKAEKENEAGEEVKEAKEQKEEEKYTCLQMVFHKQWNSTVRFCRWPIVVVFVCWFIFASKQAMLIGPLTEEESFIDKNHASQIIANIMKDNFTEGSDTLGVQFVMGVQDINRTGDNMWIADFVGVAIMDPNFNASCLRCQTFLLDFCVQLKQQDFLVKDSEDCWFKAFGEFVEKFNKRIPLDEEDFYDYIDKFRNWTLEGRVADAKKQMGFVNGTLKFVEFTAEAALRRRDPGTVKRPIYEKWEKWTQDMNDKAPIGLKSLYQTSPEGWTFMPSEQAFVDGAIQGIFIAMLFAFIILLFATQNLTQSIISITCVSGIVISVVAIMQLKGWQLGVSESICVVILIGFSVDYVIHLSSDYMHSPCMSRHEKMQQSYTEMGVSILSGSITTFGSGFFLSFGNIVTFQKFALMITSTIVIAFFTSMVFFGAVCHILGPELAKRNIVQVNDDSDCIDDTIMEKS